MPRRKTSKLFCSPDADMIFVSSDDVVFKLHSTHLNTSSEILAAPEGAIIGTDAAPLPERASVLEILFQFIEPPTEARNYRQPPVLDMEAGLFFGVAEAAEKYIIYGAMNTCLTRMPAVLWSYPFEVLNHCAKHEYWDIADSAAKKTLELSEPFGDSVTKLKAPGVLQKWLLYYNAWKKAGLEASEIFRQKLDANSACHVWPFLYAAYLRRVNETPAHMILVRFGEEAYPTCGILKCNCRSMDGEKGQVPPWARKLHDLQNGIPKFSTISV